MGGRSVVSRNGPARAEARVFPPELREVAVPINGEAVQDNCTSYLVFEHYERFGMGEENAPITCAVA
jgi:hypothetical protein